MCFEKLLLITPRNVQTCSNVYTFFLTFVFHIYRNPLVTISTKSYHFCKLSLVKKSYHMSEQYKNPLDNQDLQVSDNCTRSALENGSEVPQMESDTTEKGPFHCFF